MIIIIKINNMNNLYILTEERAKPHVVKRILEIYSNEYNKQLKVNNGIKIISNINSNEIFNSEYKIENAEINGIDNIILKIASGNSSFVDFLVFEQSSAPKECSINNEHDGNNLKLLIEETKTSDKESRNTGVYQRMSKFVYADYFYPNTPKIMLYNIAEPDDDKTPSDTSIFGTNMLLTQNVKIIGKSLKYFDKFKSIDELIEYKNGMRRPPKGNVPILITKENNSIKISGRLSKPANAGNIGHDPNIGALTAISKTLRSLGWDKDIIITQHGVKQEYVNNARSNKFFNIASILNLKLEGIDISSTKSNLKQYWHYEKNSEKMGTILLHLIGITDSPRTEAIYENHAGCERGYFYTSSGQALALPKKDKNGVNLYLPDLILKNDDNKEILLIEGKQSSTLNQGLKEIKHFEAIEDEFIKKYYPSYSITRWVSTYGENIYGNGIHPKVLFHLNKNGTFLLNEKTPAWLTDLIKRIEVSN